MVKRCVWYAANQLYLILICYIFIKSFILPVNEHHTWICLTAHEGDDNNVKSVNRICVEFGHKEEDAALWLSRCRYSFSRIFVCLWMNEWMYAWINVRIYLFMYVCMYVCMYACMCSQHLFNWIPFPILKHQPCQEFPNTVTYCTHPRYSTNVSYPPMSVDRSATENSMRILKEIKLVPSEYEISDLWGSSSAIQLKN